MKSLFLACFAAACLPEDTRPFPGELLVRLVPDSTLHAEFTTADGWEITYDTLTLVIGHVQLRGCSQYSESTSDYTRILGLLEPGAQTVATAYALGRCEVGIQLAHADRESVLGPGVPESHARVLRSEAAVLTVAGTAERVGVQFEFEWTFRQALDYERCASVLLRSRDQQTLDLTVRAAELFRDPNDRELGFDVFAASDRDGDLAITLDELAASGSLAGQLNLERVPQIVRPPNPDTCEIHPLPYDPTREQ